MICHDPSPTTSLSSSQFSPRMFYSRLPILLLTAVLLPLFVQAGLFYGGSAVKMLDAKLFKKAMRENVRLTFVRNASF